MLDVQLGIRTISVRDFTGTHSHQAIVGAARSANDCRPIKIIHKYNDLYGPGRFYSFTRLDNQSQNGEY